MFARTSSAPSGKTFRIAITWSGVTAGLTCLFFILYALLLGNLFLLIWGMTILGLFLVHPLLAWQALGKLEPSRKIPDRITRFQPFLCSVGLHNRHRLLSLYSLKVQDVQEQEPVDKPCFFFRLPPDTSQNTFYRHAFIHRGRARFTGMLVTTTYPLGLFQFRIFLPLEQEILVYPEKDSNPSRRSQIETFIERESGSSLRFFQPGDHVRWIHWPASFRSGHSMVRSESRNRPRPVWLRIDNRLVPDIAGGFIRAEDRFERLVSCATGYAESFLELGWEVGVISRGELVSPVAGMQNLEQIVRFLALLSFADAPYPTPPYQDLVLDVSSQLQE